MKTKLDQGLASKPATTVRPGVKRLYYCRSVSTLLRNVKVSFELQIKDEQLTVLKGTSLQPKLLNAEEGLRPFCDVCAICSEGSKLSYLDILAPGRSAFGV